MAETLEKKVYVFPDGKVLKFKGKMPEMCVSKCPHLSCDKFYFEKDGLDTHRVVEHGEVPKNLNVSLKDKGKFYNRNSLLRLNKKVQIEALRRLYAVLNIDVDYIRKPLTTKIKRWLDDRRTKSIIEKY